jgi:hypothetical protein
MVCKTAERDSCQKVYLEIERGQTKAENEPFELGASGKGILDNDTYNLMEQLN